MNEPTTFPKDWKTIVMRRIIPTNTMVATCQRSMRVPSEIILSFCIKQRIKLGANSMMTTERNIAIILIKQM